MVREPYPISNRERERTARDIMRVIDTVRGLRPRDVVLLKTGGKGREKIWRRKREEEEEAEGKDDEKGTEGGKTEGDDFDDAVFSVSVAA